MAVSLKGPGELQFIRLGWLGSGLLGFASGLGWTVHAAAPRAAFPAPHEEQFSLKILKCLRLRKDRGTVAGFDLSIGHNKTPKESSAPFTRTRHAEICCRSRKRKLTDRRPASGEAWVFKAAVSPDRKPHRSDRIGSSPARPHRANHPPGAYDFSACESNAED